MSEAEGVKKVETLYRDNEIDGFRMGALFDLRVRFAFEMLTQGGAAAIMGDAGEALRSGSAGNPHMVTGSSAFSGEAEIAEMRGRLAARAALAAVSELVRLAEKQGLVTPFPEGGDVSTTMKRHAPRLARWAGEQHLAQQREQASLAGRIATPQGTPAAILPAGGNSGQSH